MKDQILKLLDSNIIGASDDAYRAKRQFSGMSSEELDSEYGQSGRTCRDILNHAEIIKEEAAMMKKWFIDNIKENGDE